jgi:hypothetical protein
VTVFDVLGDGRFDLAELLGTEGDVPQRSLFDAARAA